MQDQPYALSGSEFVPKRDADGMQETNIGPCMRSNWERPMNIAKMQECRSFVDDCVIGTQYGCASKKLQ